MTDKDICLEFKLAKRPAHQIEILAELEQKSVIEICDAIYRNGMLDKRAGKYKNIYLTLRMKKEGYTDPEIAYELGLKETSVRAYKSRYRYEMECINVKNRTKKLPKKDFEKELADAAEIIEMLKKEIKSLKMKLRQA